MLVVAYYTTGTPYEAEAELLGASLRRAGMAHEIVPVPDCGSWDANTAQKPLFLREQRERRSGPLVYLDVDAFVHEPCGAYFDGLASEGYDFGAHWFAGPAKGHDQSECRRDASGNLVGWWMLSGTLFLGDTPGCRALLDAWIDLNAWGARHGIPGGGGQKHLWFAVTEMPALRAARLPGRFCYVFDKAFAYPESEPCIIEHTIASRDNRRGDGRTNKGRHRRMAELWRIVEGKAAA